MCWITKKPPIRQTADENIEVFKFGVRNANSPLSPVRSHYYDFIWEIDKAKPEVLEEPIHNYYVNNWALYKGFYSYRDCTSDIVGYELRVYSPKKYQIGSYYIFNLVKINCIIPKGGEYYVNEHGECISDILIAKSFEDLTETV